MTAETILRDMTARGITLIPNGDLLDIEAPDDLLTDDVVQTLRTHKADLLVLLAEPKFEPGRCPICHEPANLQDRARDSWFCPSCRAWFDSQGQSLPKPERVRPFTLEDQEARQLLADLLAVGCGFVLGGEFGDELRLTHPTRIDAGLWTRFENAGAEFRRLAREAAEQDAGRWEARNEWAN